MARCCQAGNTFTVVQVGIAAAAVCSYLLLLLPAPGAVCACVTSVSRRQEGAAHKKRHRDPGSFRPWFVWSVWPQTCFPFRAFVGGCWVMLGPNSFPVPGQKQPWGKQGSFASQVELRASSCSSAKWMPLQPASLSSSWHFYFDCDWYSGEIRKGMQHN